MTVQALMDNLSKFPRKAQVLINQDVLNTETGVEYSNDCDIIECAGEYVTLRSHKRVRIFIQNIDCIADNGVID